MARYDTVPHRHRNKGDDFVFDGYEGLVLGDLHKEKDGWTAVPNGRTRGWLPTKQFRYKKDARNYLIRG